MMRMLVLVPMVMVAACAETAEGDTKTEEKSAAAAAIDPGQWETTVEVTKLTQMDKGSPAIKAAAGSKTTATSCIAPDDVKKPNPVLFTAIEEGSCDYKDLYMSGGRINGGLSCKRPGLGGEVMTSVEGKFTADSFEGTSTVETYLYGDGDVRIANKISGRRIGDCAGEA